MMFCEPLERILRPQFMSFQSFCTMRNGLFIPVWIWTEIIIICLPINENIIHPLIFIIQFDNAFASFERKQIFFHLHKTNQNDWTAVEVFFPTAHKTSLHQSNQSSSMKGWRSERERFHIGNRALYPIKGWFWPLCVGRFDLLVLFSLLKACSISNESLVRSLSWWFPTATCVKTSLDALTCRVKQLVLMVKLQ